MSTSSNGPDAWPSYILERASQTPPENCAVIPGSTPVVSFGHPLDPKVATLGINPSSREFLNGTKDLLRGQKRRLATLDSIGATNHAEIDQRRASAIVDDCASYFERQPYWWFKSLDHILTEGLGVSYFHRTACHLDLVQWATDPVWGKLSNPQRQLLLDSDREFLMQQLRHEGYRVVAVAGRTALDWVQKAGVVRWEAVDVIEDVPRTTFYRGTTDGTLFVAWSCNVQSQHGARKHIHRLAELLKKHAGNELGRKAVAEDSAGFDKGTHFRSRKELVDALQRWHDDTDEDTIGDLSFGRAPWLSFDTPAGLADLNADTKRDAVERMLKHAQGHADAVWQVIENNRGKVNKIVFDPSGTHEGWYAYLREPLAAPQEIS